MDNITRELGRNMKQRPSECGFCDSLATCIITRIMQPSYPHFSCDKCSEKTGYMIIKKLEEPHERDTQEG